MHEWMASLQSKVEATTLQYTITKKDKAYLKEEYVELKKMYDRQKNGDESKGLEASYE
jgi:hypothetical protein